MTTTTTGWISTIEGWSFRQAGIDGGWQLRTPEGFDVTKDGDVCVFLTIGDLTAYVRQTSERIEELGHKGRSWRGR